ncbi:MAG: hypothetical protein K0Q99_1973 [Clostridia bacterium]|jgi:hypothetical protein|nr:hypothetical protein [Clostridia bacterium]
MFGYIMPDKPELKMKEFELFRAYYCGVCKSMGRSFGPIARFALNYEAVFLGLLLAAVNKESSTMNKEACIANPFKKKWVVRDNKYVDFAADINVLLTYYKLIDNWQDEKHLASYGAKLLFGTGYSKASKRSENTDSIIKAALAKQSKLEQEKCSSIDKAAEPTAEMIRDILLVGCRDANQEVQKAMGWLGYNIGKWIYTIDAYDDIEKDIKSGSYNPLLLQYGYNQQPTAEFKNEIKQDIERDLIFTLSQAAGCIELLDMNHKGIIENIVYMGMNNKTNNILCGDCKQCSSQKSKGAYENEKSI